MSDLARQLLLVADVLDASGFQVSGVLRQAARELAGNGSDNGDGCRGCGAPLTQPATGRPREWCDEPCRRRYRP